MVGPRSAWGSGPRNTDYCTTRLPFSSCSGGVRRNETEGFVLRVVALAARARFGRGGGRCGVGSLDSQDSVSSSFPPSPVPPPNQFYKILAFLLGSPAPVYFFLFFYLHRFTRTFLAFPIGSPAPNWHFPSVHQHLTGISIGSPAPNWHFPSAYLTGFFFLSFSLHRFTRT